MCNIISKHIGIRFCENLSQLVVKKIVSAAINVVLINDIKCLRVYNLTINIQSNKHIV